MSSSPRRSTPDATIGGNPIADNQGFVPDASINGNTAAANQDNGDQLESSGHAESVGIGQSALRRYTLWITLTVASSISYVSLAVETPAEKSLAERQWCFAIIGISLCVSLVVAGCFIAPDCNACTKAFVSPSSATGRYLELFLSMIVLIFWSIGLPTIMNPSNSIAVGNDQIINANLYLASWVCFGCIFFIMGDLVDTMVNGPEGTAAGLSRLDPETGEYITAAPFSPVYYRRLWETRRGKWFALTAITGIAMSASARIYQADGCGQYIKDGNNTCRDTKVAISMTVIGAMLSVIMVVVSGTDISMAEYIEKIGALATSFVYIVVLGVTTFGDGPGRSLGNLFFATWGGFVISLLIAVDCFHDWISQRALAASIAAPVVTANGVNGQIELQEGAEGDDSDI